VAGGNKNNSPKVKKRKAQRGAADRAARVAKASRWQKSNPR
jgi:hypothetical protein